MNWFCHFLSVLLSEVRAWCINWSPTFISLYVQEIPEVFLPDLYHFCLICNKVFFTVVINCGFSRIKTILYFFTAWKNFLVVIASIWFSSLRSVLSFAPFLAFKFQSPVTFFGKPIFSVSYYYLHTLYSWVPNSSPHWGYTLLVFYNLRAVSKFT